jgi:hypothetical protein
MFRDFARKRVTQIDQTADKAQSKTNYLFREMLSSTLNRISPVRRALLEEYH